MSENATLSNPMHRFVAIELVVFELCPFEAGN